MEWSGWEIEAMSFTEPSACAYTMHGSTGGDSGLARAFEDGARSIKHNFLPFERRALHLLLWQHVVYLRSSLVCICSSAWMSESRTWLGPHTLHFTMVTLHDCGINESSGKFCDNLRASSGRLGFWIGAVPSTRLTVSDV